MPKNKDGIWEPEGGPEAYDKLPHTLSGGVRRYIEDGTLPGDFLQAVISNDLTNAVARADPFHIFTIRDVVFWFYNEAPAPCWGSKKKMGKWSKERRKEREQREKVEA